MRLFNYSLTISLLFSAHFLAAQVTNLGTFDIGFNDINANFKTTIGNKLFFSAPVDRTKVQYGTDIWVSDGTPFGTKSLNIKQLASTQIGQTDSLILYVAYGDVDRKSVVLWQLDGQTLQQTKIFTGIEISQLMQKNETFYFTAKETAAPNTYFLFSFNAKTGQLNKIAPSSFAFPINGTSPPFAHSDSLLLYFAFKQINNQFVPFELWRTDGTPQGTFMIDSSRNYLFNIRGYKGKFYFNQREQFQTSDYSLNSWTTDGTSKPTKLPFKLDFTTGVLTDKGFIGVGNDSIHGTDLWFSDLVSNTAQNIGDLDSTRYGSLKNGQLVLQKIGSYPNSFTNFNNKVYFFSTNDSCRLAFYETDGTKAGTKLVKTMVKRAEAYYEAYARRTFVANGKIYAEISTPQNGSEMFVSDGTTDGTKILDVWKGGGNSAFWDRYRSVDFTRKNAYFVANNGISGNQIWQANGSTDAFKRISNIPIVTPTRGTTIATIGSLDNQFVFTTSRDSFMTIWRFDEDKPTNLTEEKKPENYKWLTSLGAVGYALSGAKVTALSVDGKQNTLILGTHSYSRFAYYDTTQQLIRNDRNIVTYPNHSLFLTKYDSLGKLAWAKDLFCAYVNSDRKNMTIDEDGNIYIIAQNYQEFSGKPIGIYVDNILIHSGLGVSDFVLKFDTNGKLLWFKKGITNFPNNKFLSIEAKGKNVYITGKNGSSSIFDNKTVPAGLFAIKMDNDGNTLWAKKIGDDIVVEKVGSMIDNAGNLIVFDERNGLSKVKSEDGTVVWTKKGPLSINSKMTAQNDGSFFILTDFAGSISFDNRKITTSKAKGLALIGVDANGTVIQATVLNQDASFLPIALTSDENGFLKAIYYKEKEGSGTLQYPSWNINNKRSIVAQQFTSSGLELAQREIFTRLSELSSLRATFDKNDDFVFMGQNVQYIDTIPNIPLSYGYYQILARFSFKGKMAEPNDKILKLSDITLSPNPVSNLLTLSSDDIDFREANVMIYNLLGQIQGITINENNPRLKMINVSNLIKGMYVLVIQSGDEILTKKFTKF